MVGVFLTGVLSTHHVSREGQGEDRRSSGQQLACCLQQHLLDLFPIFTLILYQTQSQLELKKKKARVKAFLFPFPHQMCSAASAVKWISVDRQMRCSLGSLWPLAES